MGIENQAKTFILLAVLTGLLLLVGSYFGGQSGLLVAFVFALVLNFGSYWFSDKIVLAMYRAKPIGTHEHPALHRIVADVSKQAGIPKPPIYLIPDASPNAFATGRSPNHAAIAYTTGILQLLNEEELRGVTAHEISHVKNRDTLVTTVAATIAGVISFLAQSALWFGLGRGRDDNQGASHVVASIVLIILAPILATIIRLAISRSREFLADETGARAIRNPKALASALHKLEHGVASHPMRLGSEATSSLFIVNPFSAGALAGLFSTHPPLGERVARLNAMRV